jgi:hypothetical protein
VSILELDQKSLFYTLFMEMFVIIGLWVFHRLVYDYDHKNIFDTEKTQWLAHRLVWEPINTLGTVWLVVLFVAFIEAMVFDTSTVGDKMTVLTYGGFILLCAYHYTVDKMQALHHMVGLCKWIGITLLYKTSAPFVEYIIPW